MKLLFRQRFFSWFDSYDIYDEANNPVYTVEGKMSWGHRLEIYDTSHRHVGGVREEIFTLLPQFALFIEDQRIGEIRKKFTFFKPCYNLDVNGWSVNGDFLEWEYQVADRSGNPVMWVTKELFHMTDTYVLNINYEEDALLCLMIVLAVDAAKCSSGS